MTTVDVNVESAAPKKRKTRAGSVRVDVLCLVIALVVHGPILSLGAWAWIADIFSRQSDMEIGDEDVEVPMELDLQDDPSKPNKKDSEGEEVQVVVDSNETIPVAVDAGAPPDQDAAPKDAGPPDAAPPDASTPKDAGPPPKGPIQEAPLESVHAPPNPSGNINNVEIVLVGKVLRTHPIGLKLGSMLPNIKQWKSFFDNTGIDAVRDVDLMVIMGPEVMARNGQVDVMMLFNTKPDEIHAAVDKILERSKPVGGWLDDVATPTAQGKADGSDRLFVLVPKQAELYVTPPPRQKKKKKDEPDWTPDEKDKALKDKVAKIARLKSPSTDVDFGINISVKEPGKLSKVKLPLLGVTQLIPDSFEKFVLRAYPRDDGGARVRIELWDDTRENAAQDMPGIQGQYGLLQVGARSAIELDLPDLTFEIDPRPDTHGRIIEGEGNVSKAVLEKIVGMGEDAIRKGKEQH